MKLTEILNEDGNYQEVQKNQTLILAYGEGSGRDLDFVGVPVSLKGWTKTMSIAVDGGYNDFEPIPVARALRDALYELSIGEDEVQFIPAREGSVALYIQSASDNYLEELGNYIDSDRKGFSNVQEIDMKEGKLRLWWD